VVLERADAVGGTWRDNSYPGCACDVPSHLYSFSFAPNPGWSRSFSPQPEIWAYLRRLADEHGVTQRTRFGAEVMDAAWNEERGHWEIETTAGDLTARVLIAGFGGCPTSRASRTSRARSSTAPGGTTTTT
jgi:cation diffusion facilitator CzcD-associated flavoprotein CzcO